MLPVGFPGAAFSAWRERFTAGVPFWKNGLVLSQYNKDLWKGNIPSTTDELLAYAQANTDTNAGTYGVLNQHTGAYNVAPFINGYGGYIINNDAKPGLNLQATKDAVAYNKRFSAYQSDGEYNTVTTLFTEKKAHSIISGPWLVSSIKAAGINLGTKPLTSFKLPNGKPMCPYIGVQSFGVCKHGAKGDDILFYGASDVAVYASADGLHVLRCLQLHHQQRCSSSRQFRENRRHQHFQRAIGRTRLYDHRDYALP